MSDVQTAPRVRLLPTEIIHRIAAGEVVDKPASILKEFVENSVDAGATSLRITVVDGGLKSIVVEDDGHGLTREDLENCAQRHATSKIQSIDDLEAIPHLGFRGEALAAAASVAKLTIETAHAESGGWTLRVVGGVREPVVPSARRKGTKVSLEDLFFNVPARRKFLRKPGLEANDVVDALEGLALAHPGVRMQWVLTDSKGEIREQRSFEPGTRVERLETLYADRTWTGVVTRRIDAPAEGVRFIEVSMGLPPAQSAQAKSVRLDVNGRPIQDKRLPYVAREAFSGLIEIGRFPWAHIAVSVDPSIVDVNVHPQKKELRWSAGFQLSSHVFGLIRGLLAEGRPAKANEVVAEALEFNLTAAPRGAENLFTPTSESSTSADRRSFETSIESSGARVAMSSLATSSFSESGATIVTPTMPPAIAETAYVPRSTAVRGSLQPGVTPKFRFSDLRVVGEVGAAWIVCEHRDGMLVIDQHAAHERVQFERELKKLSLLRTKPLFIPIPVKVPASLRDDIPAFRQALEAAGFELTDAEVSGANEVEIIAVPEADRALDWNDLVHDVVRRAESGLPIEGLIESLKVKVAASLACHGSVRRGQRLSNDEVRALLTALDEIEWGGLCPHGRPVWFLLRHDDIEARFHR